MQFRFAHRALKSQKETIVIAAGVIQCFLIGNQRVRNGTNVQQFVPVAIATCQTRYFQRQDDPDLAQGSRGHHVVKSKTTSRSRSRFSLVIIDYPNELIRPSQFLGTLSQVALSSLAFAVVDHLMI